MKYGARNQIEGVVKSIKKGNIMGQVSIDIPAPCKMGSVMTVDSINDLDLKVGDKVESGEKVEIKTGNTMPLKNIPLGTDIHNVEMKAGKGGQIVRSAGGYAVLAAREGDYATLKLPSGEIRKIRVECRATIGVIGNADHENIVLGKAGRSRWLGIRPQTRGMAMNPVDHPMGGGEGKSKSGGGRKHPKSPWGQLAKGLKTRNKKKASQKLIVRGRNAK